MAKKLIKKLNDREIYAKFADYASADENGDKISDRKVKSVSVSGRTMTVHKTYGEQEVPVVPVPDVAGLILKSGEAGAYEWSAAGTIIDDLQGLDDMGAEQKQAFIDTAFVPVRGTISGELTTRKATGSELLATVENKIESITVAGTPIEPVNKQVNIPLATTAAAGAMSSTDKSKLDNLVNIKSIGNMLDLNENGNLSVSFSGAIGPLYVDISDGTGGYDLAYDDTLTTTYHQGEEKPNRLSVAVPVPDNTSGEGAILCWQSGAQGIEPHAVWCSPGNNDILVDTTNGDIRLAFPVPDPKGWHQANDGDVLTYNAQSDEIVWAAPQGGGLALPDVQELIGKNGSDGPTTYENELQLTVVITVDENNTITNVSSPRWRIDKEQGSGSYYYFN